MNVIAALLIAVFCLVDVVVVVLVALSMGRKGDQQPPRRPTQPAGRVANIFLLLFIGVWSVATLYFDFLTVRGTINQMEAVHFPTVEGEVVRCTATEDTGGEFSSHDVNILYSYTVADDKYTCSRVRFLKLWGKTWVKDFVAKHPPGTEVTVHYDPNDPSRAILLPGIGGQELFAPMFFLPFNLVMLAAWLLLAKSFIFGSPAYFRVRAAGDTSRVRLPEVPPFLAPVLSVFCVPLVLAVVVALCAGMPVSLETMAVAWLVFLGITALAFQASARRAISGKDDLIVRQLKRDIILPQTFDRKSVISVQFSAVVGIDVVSMEKKGDDAPQTVYIPTLCLRNDNVELHEEKLVEWNDEQEAHRLAAWLRSEIVRLRPEGGTGDADWDADRFLDGGLSGR